MNIVVYDRVMQRCPAANVLGVDISTFAYKKRDQARFSAPDREVKYVTSIHIFCIHIRVFTVVGYKESNYFSTASKCGD